jgi:hypothetical protein
VAETQYSENLVIEQDLHFQQRMWAVQRVGWVVIMCILVAALLGLLGSGPLASRTLNSPQGGFRLEYERFLRQRTPTRLHLLVHTKDQPQQEVRVWCDRTLFEHFEVTQIVPPPVKVETAAGSLTYIFPLTAQVEQLLIVFSLESESFGLLSSRIGVGDDSLYFRQLVYP